MKKSINYEKDILFKTNIGEITTISLEHDFTIDENYLRGEFVLTGEYKANELSINTEPFEYRLPLEYELEPNCDRNTLSYDIDNFEYTTKEDCLSIIIDFGIRYEEKEIAPKIPEITEEDLSNDDFDIMYGLPKLKTIEEFEEPREELNIIKEEKKEMEDEIIKPERLDEEDEKVLLDTALQSDDYITYHVHIVRENETLEEIAKTYNTSVEVIKEYNQIDTIEIKSKLIIPEVNE